MIFLTSGYRSPEYNADLKKAGGIVAKTSTHMDGLALDFYIEGVNGKELWELIQEKNCCGVGHYGGKESISMLAALDSGKRPHLKWIPMKAITTGACIFPLTWIGIGPGKPYVFPFLLSVILDSEFVKRQLCLPTVKEVNQKLR